MTQPEERPPATGSGHDALGSNPAATPPAPPRCDLCGAVMIERHCRLVCPQCGYQRDCSDP